MILMTIKKETFNIFQLVLLLFLLYWSFTWNLPTNFDSIQEERSKISKKYHSIKYTNKNSKVNLGEICSEVSPASSKKATIGQTYQPSDDVILPAFDAWKELELLKQGTSHYQISSLPKSPSHRRKLNYASEKCGAKVLASNPEAKFRKAVLNEKQEEYMLNPCAADMWFIIELCDTIETIEIGLANYELYSSSSKLFVVSWSDIYPTQQWRFLGMFEAEDRRTLQIFTLENHNLGKYIKTEIKSHHGKEHYCPLSVFRIMGYSMAYEFEVAGTVKEKDTDYISQEKDPYVSSITNEQADLLNFTTEQAVLETKHTYTLKFDLLGNNITKKVCTKKERYCLHSNAQIQKETSNFSCLFYKSIISNLSQKKEQKINLIRNNSVMAKSSTTKTKIRKNFQSKKFNLMLEHGRKSDNNVGLNRCPAINFAISENIFYSVEQICTGIKKTYNIKFIGKKNTNKQQTLSDVIQKTSISKTAEINSKEFVRKRQNVHTQRRTTHFIKVEEYSHKNKEANKDKFSESSELTVGSAAQIQKESVLMKLTMRLETSETNLKLINRYLQQLSESYKQRIEEIQLKADDTAKAIEVEIDKAKIALQQQDIVINRLIQSVKKLENKVEILTNGEKSVLKMVLELHGFFLIMEFIIMSTIFSIFMNRYRKNKFYRV